MPPEHVLHYITCIDSSFNIIHRNNYSSHIFCNCTCVRTKQNAFMRTRLHTSCRMSKSTQAFLLQGKNIHCVPCMHTKYTRPKTFTQHSAATILMHSKLDWNEIKHLSCRHRRSAAVLQQITLLQAAFAVVASASYWTRACTFPWWQGVSIRADTHPKTCSAYDTSRHTCLHTRRSNRAKNHNTRSALDTGQHMRRSHDRISKSAETCTFMLSSWYWPTLTESRAATDTNQQMQVHTKLSAHVESVFANI
jgi:hypothetical protein